MAYDPAIGQLVLFGGTGANGTVLNDTWTYNGTTWTQLSPLTSPPARSDSSMAYDPAIRPAGPLRWDECHRRLPLTTPGRSTAPPGPSCPPRQPAGAYRLVHGLRPGDGPTGPLRWEPYWRLDSVGFNDTWTYNGTTWTQQSPITSPSPPASTHPWPMTQ